jgi:hypothetical protein
MTSPASRRHSRRSAHAGAQTMALTDAISRPMTYQIELGAHTNPTVEDHR